MIQLALSLFEVTSGCDVVSLGNAGGFSGAQLWRVRGGVGDFCVRCWPVRWPTKQHLEWIHYIQSTAGRGGCSFVPMPIRSRLGNSFELIQDRLWEVTPWMAGEPDLLAAYSERKLANACRGLAQFHDATAACGKMISDRPGIATSNPSPGLFARQKMATRFLGKWAMMQEAVRQLHEPSIRRRLQAILELTKEALVGIPPMLSPLVRQSVALQPCLRDTRPCHFLFQGDELTGLIDYGAAKMESVAFDLARLFAGLENLDGEARRCALASYEEVRVLSSVEKRILPLAMYSGAVLAGLRWVSWLALEGKVFESQKDVLGRLDEVIGQSHSASKLLVE